MPKSHDLKKVDPGAEKLNKAFSDLGASRESWRAADKATGASDRTPQEAKNHQDARAANLSPTQRISRYLERLENVLSEAPGQRGSEAPLSRLQQRLIKSAAIDISDQALVRKMAHGIFVSEKRSALERGHGAHTQAADFNAVSDGYIKLVHEKHAIQVSSLSRWTSYLAQNDAQYPPWFRYLAIRSVLKMGEFNRDAPKFGRRTRDTIAAFPELNSEALGLVFKLFSDPSGPSLQKVINQNENLSGAFRQAIASKSFSALYAVSLVACNQTLDRSRIEGEWKKYDQGSDHTILEGELSGKGTGWCTATGSAQQHLQGGDFYVFYTKDNNEQYSIPRVAIRMENEKIAEIRGIASNQELEPEFVDIVEQKGKTLPGYERFQKASADMKRLTEIDKRCFVRDAEGKIETTLVPDPALSKDELRFLYEVDSKISSFGTESDARIEELRTARPDTREDYSIMYNVPLEHVAVRKEDISSSTRVYIGDLGPEDYRILNERTEPLVIAGDVDFAGCTSLTSIPEGVLFNGDACFAGCTSLTTIPEGVVFNGTADFAVCTSLTTIAEGVVFNGYAYFAGCTSLRTIGSGTQFHDSYNFYNCPALISNPADFLVKPSFEEPDDA